MKYLFLVIVFAWTISAARSVNAHPHAWIDLWIEVVFDSTGAITGLRETWLFDDFYSVYATEGMDLDKDGQPDKEPMAKLVSVNIKSLSELLKIRQKLLKTNILKNGTISRDIK